MKKIKTRLIHLLGGITVNESKKGNFNSYKLGIENTCLTLKQFSETLYCMPAEEWCKSLYQHISKQYNYIKEVTNEKQKLWI